MKSKVQEQVTGSSKSESGAVTIDHLLPNTAAIILMNRFNYIGGDSFKLLPVMDVDLCDSLVIILCVRNEAV